MKKGILIIFFLASLSCKIDNKSDFKKAGGISLEEADFNLTDKLENLKSSVVQRFRMN